MKLLQLSELFAAPVQSTVRAQFLALQETISQIEEIGVEGEKAPVLKIKTERLVEKHVIDEKTNESKTIFDHEPIYISIPILALAMPSVIAIKNVEVEFDVEMVEPISTPIKSRFLPIKKAGLSLASTKSIYAKKSSDISPTMHVKMNIGSETSEALGRINDLLNTFLESQTLSERKSN